MFFEKTVFNLNQIKHKISHEFHGFFYFMLIEAFSVYILFIIK